MATPRLGLVVEDKPTELSCIFAASFRLKICAKLPFLVSYTSHMKI